MERAAEGQPMQIQSRTVQKITVVEIIGEITGATAGQVETEVLALAGPAETRMLLDMSQVPYMSSAGLRVLLMIFRRISGKGGKVHLVGLADDLRNTMSVTGFLDFFPHHATLDEGVAALA